MYEYPNILALYQAALKEDTSKICNALCHIKLDIIYHTEHHTRHPKRITPYIRSLDKVLRSINIICDTNTWSNPLIQQHMTSIENASNALKIATNKERAKLNR